MLKSFTPIKYFFFSFLFILTIIPIILYFYTFHYNLSTNHSRWAEFGSFFGGVIGPLISVSALLGLIVSIEQTRQHFSIQRNESTFFSLLNFHILKIEQLTYKENKGYDIFIKLSDEFKAIYREQCVCYAIKNIEEKTKELPFFAYGFLSDKIKERYGYSHHESKNIVVEYFTQGSDKHELLKGIIDISPFGMSREDKDMLAEIGDTIVRQADVHYRMEKLKEIYDIFYHDYGHIIGHYMRSVYYILENINGSHDCINYSKIFRAQLSRFELTMLYYNMTSRFSSNKFNQLLINYNMLNGVYENDICYTPDIESLNNDILHTLKLNFK